MSAHFHAVVWIDHTQAKVFHFNHDTAEKEVVHAAKRHVHLHHRAHSNGSGHEPPDQEFLHQVATHLATAQAILVIGPAGAKTELVAHMKSHDPKVAKAVVAVEPADHPTDGEILKRARAFFDTADRTLPQKG